MLGEVGLKLHVPSVEPKAVQEARGADRIIEGQAEGILGLGGQSVFRYQMATDSGGKSPPISMSVRYTYRAASSQALDANLSIDIRSSSRACSPTRANLGTGRRSSRLSEGSMTRRSAAPTSAFILPSDTTGEARLPKHRRWVKPAGPRRLERRPKLPSLKIIEAKEPLPRERAEGHRGVASVRNPKTSAWPS